MDNVQSFNDINECTKFEYKKESTVEIKPKAPAVWRLIWIDQTIHKSNLTHENIPVFSFAPLDVIKKDYLEQGYSSEEVESMIAGLSELPEYAKSKRNKQSKNIP